MITDEIVVQYIGGPTAIFELAGLRLITDPGFDAAGTRYQGTVYELHKVTGPRIGLANLGPIDYVLLSHDHHFDNLDNAGRAWLPNAGQVLTTVEGAARLGGNARGLKPWEKVDIATPDGRVLEITATPCQHGPVHGERGPVIGFVLQFRGESQDAVYVTGDTVWFRGVEEVGERFDVGLIIPFMGAAIVPEVGKEPLTFTADDGILLARHFKQAQIMPLHFEDWAHFTESRKLIQHRFEQEGLAQRLRWPQ